MSNAPRSRFQFGIRTLLEIIAVVAFVLAIIYGKSTPVADTGRYQIVAGPKEVFFWDTKTGNVWANRNGAWLRSGIPGLEP